MNTQKLTAPQPTKLEATLDSKNFLTSLITLGLLILAANGADIPDPDASGELIYDTVKSGNLIAIITVLIPNFINPLMKIVKSKFDTGFLKSLNFWTQAGTVVLIGVTALGIQFPEGAAANLVESIFGGEFQTIMVALVINVFNPIWHFFVDRSKNQGTTLATS